MTAGPLTPVAALMVREGARAPEVGDILQIATATPDGVVQYTWIPPPQSQFTITTVKVANFTASIFERVLYDPTAGTFTILAPPNPVAGNRFGIKNVSADVTAITVGGNGNNIENPTVSFALAGSFLLGSDGIGVEFEFSGSVWLVP